MIDRVPPQADEFDSWVVIPQPVGFGGNSVDELRATSPPKYVAAGRAPARSRAWSTVAASLRYSG